jgi:hypothetical protein
LIQTDGALSHRHFRGKWFDHGAATGGLTCSQGWRQVPLLLPSWTDSRFSTRSRRWTLTVLRLAAVTLQISRTVTRPRSRARALKGGADILVCAVRDLADRNVRHTFMDTVRVLVSEPPLVVYIVQMACSFSPFSPLSLLAPSVQLT